MELDETIDFSLHPLYLNATLLHQKYVVEGLTIKQIAAQFFCSTWAVQKHLKKFCIRDSERGKQRNRKRTLTRYGKKWKNGELVQNNAEQSTIKKISALRNTGKSYEEVASILNALGIKTGTGEGKWHAMSVKRIVRAAL